MTRADKERDIQLYCDLDISQSDPTYLSRALHHSAALLFYMTFMKIRQNHRDG